MNTVIDSPVDAVRRLQPTLKGAQARLHGYPDEVLRAAIEAEHAAADSRPLMISMLEAELVRRAGEPAKEKPPMTTVAAAPVAPAVAAAARIALAAITPSKTNPRKNFDKGALEELTDSIKRLDVLQPILVRPNGGAGKFELVAGERRFRAAKAAGLVDIPATVRELTDAEALEVQVVENLQRSDLHELEEAEGYEALMKCQHADGSKYSVDQIAAKVGKSKAYVYARLKLTALCPEGRKAFYDGKIDASKALLVARIAHHDTQRQALKDISESRHGGESMSYREAHRHVVQTYMLVLKEAPFDVKDAALVPKAGACGPCPKRTGNQADLFGDVKNADVCTDPKCFDEKRLAHFAVAAKELEKKGKKVVFGEAAKKAFPNWDSPHTWSRDQLQGGFVKMDEVSYASGRGKKVSELLGDDYEPVHLQHPGTGQIIKVATQQAVAAAAQKTSKSKKGGNGKGSSSGGAQRQHREPEKSADQIFRERLFMEIVKKIPASPGKAELRFAAQGLLKACDETDLLADAMVPRQDGKPHDYQSAKKALEATIEKMTADGLCRLAVALEASYEVGNSYSQPKRLLEIAKACRVDPAKVKKTIADEAKAAAVKTAKPTKPTPAAAAPKKKAPAKKKTAKKVR